MHYYNDNDPFAAAWLRELIRDGLIPPGDVDERGIEEVQASDLRGYRQHHFFCGVAGWPLALALAGWPADAPVWTGSCPCQPFSAAGKRQGTADERHLWPEFLRLIRECRPQTIFGEQVASAEVVGTELEAAFVVAVQGGDYARANKLAHKLFRSRSLHYWARWIDGIRADMEAEDYSVRFDVLGAHSLGAPHIRQRLFWVAYSAGGRCQRQLRQVAAQEIYNLSFKALDTWHGTGNPFEEWEKLLAQPNVRRMDDGISSGMDIGPRLRAYGNSIIPQVAAVFIRTVMEGI